jgi:hypothetical protein
MVVIQLAYYLVMDWVHFISEPDTDDHDACIDKEVSAMKNSEISKFHKAVVNAVSRFHNVAVHVAEHHLLIEVSRL